MRGLAERGRQIEGWFAVRGGHVGIIGQIERICICRLLGAHALLQRRAASIVTYISPAMLPFPIH